MMPTTQENDYPLDHIHRWKDWCAMVGISTTTGWRMCKAGKGPVITRLTAKIKGVRHRHYLAWLEAGEGNEEVLGCQPYQFPGRKGNARTEDSESVYLRQIDAVLK